MSYEGNWFGHQCLKLFFHHRHKSQSCFVVSHAAGFVEYFRIFTSLVNRVEMNIYNI